MDRTVQQTDYDALSCRMAAITRGYLPSQKQIEQCGYEGYTEVHVEYCNVLRRLSRRLYSRVQKACTTLLPVMNYGSFVRTVSVDVELHKYVAGFGGRAQVVNLGCGSDLRMCMLLERYPELHYVDVDFAETVKMKREVLMQSAELCRRIGASSTSPQEQDCVLHGPRYRLLAGDLRDTGALLELLQKHTDADLPTVVITECVLCYLPREAAQALIREVCGFYKSGSWISYDPIGGGQREDRFGSIMQSNLREFRQLELPTLMEFNSKEKYSARFPAPSNIQTMWEYYMTDISEDEKRKLKTLQFLDEVEELEILLSHYVILVTSW
ncbi:ADR178Wp [Eremothecium gossypii ATCC 10895]|uniref:Leucine carboxyl methyltransferase 1 n=1 Tax=Eremothecium gossypii (strain ATCC 10895 / CBS 109.51 / FGSC 9923 / NRRL Y-1056) TaxID=284811 RepID=LCMT1_EREGS|nr:ADR178Wp [Eremothecium gossypii ATCC 10895]Q759U5.2 RecName: Full=Leucine carboxyl methyltransferase 1; AltName: Full=Protein phosphatase methyltransferase 1; AltName: Full=[Phosphatase 2A protein]-leucine-carboxy methyltransferase 1 [Eremothecium gossypii ATCC 10895]AAS52098.2 ADR178Wp [Eremothecium gossypii ATCC 10895]AEY96397.1 FADR178Wp [Eremothecium gossypii FDAG1]